MADSGDGEDRELSELLVQRGRVRRLTGETEGRPATGLDWSEVRAEGPILLTTNKVRGRELLQELRKKVRELKKGNIIR